MDFCSERYYPISQYDHDKISVAFKKCKKSNKLK